MKSGHPSQELPAPNLSPEEENARLWSAWLHARDFEARALLASRYTGFARRVAARYYRQRFSLELQFEDYAQFAMVGLLESLDRFDNARGIAFEAFAAPRIAGAVLNGVESLSEKQRQICTRMQVRKDRARSLAEPGVTATTAEPANALQRLADVAVGLAIGFMLEEAVFYLVEDRIDPRPTPYEKLEIAELRKHLASLVDTLPETERRVIQHHYYQQVPFDAIADALGLSKGRVSQIHRAALQRLRQLNAQTHGAVLVI